MPENDAPPPLYEDPVVREPFDAAARRMQRRFWDIQAGDWGAAQAARGLQPRHLPLIAPWLVAPVLLVGAGRGTMLRALRVQGLAATGVDWSAAMVAKAREEGVTGIEHGDACDLDRADQSLATVIISTGVLLPTHAPERRCAYLAEACRVLVPGGTLLLCLWFAPGSGAAQRAAENVQLPVHTLRAQVHWDLGPLGDCLSRYGFETVDEFIEDEVLLWRLAKSHSEI